MLTEKLLEFSLIGAEWILWLLIGLSCVTLAVMVDRAVLYLRTRERLPDWQPGLARALGDADFAAARQAVAGDSLVRNVLRAGLDLLTHGKRGAGAVEQAMLGALARERARYDRWLTILGTVGNNAPFVGLFGTVLGIVQAFHEMGKFGEGAAQASNNQFVMAAIGEALVATGVGLMVAIPAVAAFNWAKAHVGGRARQAEALMRVLLSGLNDSAHDAAKG